MKPLIAEVVQPSKMAWVGKEHGRTNKRSAEALARRVKFFQDRIAARKNPANCSKCGKVRDAETKLCVRCIETQRKWVAKNKGLPLVNGESYSVEQLTAMVLQIRKEMDKMHTRFKLWQKAAYYRRNLHYRTNAIKKKYFQAVSKAQAMEYLEQTNHAYQPGED